MQYNGSTRKRSAFPVFHPTFFCLSLKKKEFVLFFQPSKNGLSPDSTRIIIIPDVSRQAGGCGNANDVTMETHKPPKCSLRLLFLVPLSKWERFFSQEFYWRSVQNGSLFEVLSPHFMEMLWQRYLEQSMSSWDPLEKGTVNCFMSLVPLFCRGARERHISACAIYHPK